jgi:hypothetical protein
MQAASSGAAAFGARVALVALCLTAFAGGGEPVASTLYFTDLFRPEFEFGSIKSVQSDGSGGRTLVDTGGGLRSIAVDLEGGKLYWTDAYHLVIRRANLDGTGQEDLVTSGLQWPRALVLDPAAGKMYWGDQIAGEINRANLDGSDVRLVVATDFHAGLALDGLRGQLYWSTSRDMFTGDILRCDIDGANVETVVTDMDKPAYLAIDAGARKLYWTDYVVDVVRRSNLDGSHVQDLYVVGSNRNPDGIGLNLAEGKVYWGQTTEMFENISKIMRMNLDGSQPQDVTPPDFGLISDVTFGPTRSFSLGDMNCDGLLDFGDINPFVLAISSRRDYEQRYPDCNFHLADVNGDGEVDFGDINPFVELLMG